MKYINYFNSYDINAFQSFSLFLMSLLSNTAERRCSFYLDRHRTGRRLGRLHLFLHNFDFIGKRKSTSQYLFSTYRLPWRRASRTTHFTCRYVTPTQKQQHHSQQITLSSNCSWTMLLEFEREPVLYSMACRRSTYFFPNLQLNHLLIV